MEKEHLLILSMVEHGEITVSEAVDLIALLEFPAEPENWSFAGFDTLTIQVCLD